jgi:ribosomal-protein-alanine N-acetyltransferase
MPPILETERLALRRFTLADAPFVAGLMNSPTWLKYIGDRKINSIENAKSYLFNGPMMSYAAYGFGLYLVELKHSHTPIGMCGLVKRDYLENLDIGYALLPAYEGMGYAHEIALATLNYAFNQLHLLRIAAITTESNLRSIKLLSKLEFVFEKNIDVDNQQLMLFIKDAHAAK